MTPSPSESKPSPSVLRVQSPPVMAIHGLVAVLTALSPSSEVVTVALPPARSILEASKPSSEPAAFTDPPVTMRSEVASKASDLATTFAVPPVTSTYPRPAFFLLSDLTPSLPALRSKVPAASTT